MMILWRLLRSNINIEIYIVHKHVDKAEVIEVDDELYAILTQI